jgi:hypothetical protein
LKHILKNIGVNSGMDGDGWKLINTTKNQFPQGEGVEIISVCDLNSFTMSTVTFQVVFRFILFASYSLRYKLPTHYSTLLRFCPVEVFAKLVDGPTGCGEVARGGYLLGTSV